MLKCEGRRPVSSRYRRSPGRPQPLEPLDQLPYVGGRRALRSLGELCVVDRSGSAFTTAIVRPGICLPIAFEMCCKLSDDLLACGGSPGRAAEGPVRVSEMEKKPALEAGRGDGGADFRGVSLPVRIPLQPAPEALDFLDSFVMIEDAPDFVQIGIPLAFPLNRCRDARRPPLSVLRASDGHTRKIEVADEGQEVARFGPASLAQDQYTRQARPRGRSSSSGAWRSSPGLPWGHRALILR